MKPTLILLPALLLCSSPAAAGPDCVEITVAPCKRIRVERKVCPRQRIRIRVLEAVPPADIFGAEEEDGTPAPLDLGELEGSKVVPEWIKARVKARKRQRKTLPAPKSVKPAPQSSRRTTAVSLAGGEAKVVLLLNRERERRGLKRLRIDPIAVKVARAHSRDMCKRGYFDHRSPDGSRPWDRLRAAGARFMAAAENIAAGYHSAQAVHAGWMKSAGHRANRLDARYTRVGVGVHQCNGAPYWTEVFMK